MAFTPDLLLAFALFAFVASITPGPNNTMLLASGVNFGFRRTIPHMLGITVGFMLMVLAVGVGLGALFQKVPMLYTVLRYVGAAYLLYLAWKIATAGPIGDASSGKSRPMSWFGAAAFQWVNPKAWVMAVGAISTYTPMNGYFTNVLVIALIFGVLNLPAVGVWAGFGSLLRNLLQERQWQRLFNGVMALLLVASLYPMLHG